MAKEVESVGSNRNQEKNSVGRIRGSTFYPTQADKIRNEHSVAKSRLSRQYEVERIELENLMAKKQAEQQLKNRKFQLEN